MKKLIVFSLLCIFAAASYSQNVEDVWMLLKNGNIPGAKKKIDECMPSNQDNPRAWLYRGNAYLMVYNRDQERKAKDPEYVSKNPDAIYIAYESFYRSLELNSELIIEGILTSKDGQIACAGPLYNMGYEAYTKNDYDNTVKYLSAAIKCFKLSGRRDDKEFVGIGYYYLADITQRLKGEEAYLTVLDDAVKAKTGVVVVYQMAYDVYSKRNDWDKCKEILAAAKKDVPAKEQGPIFALDLNYSSSTGDTVRFEKAMKKVKENVKDIELVSEASNYLVDGGKYEEAIELVKQCVDSNPESALANFQVAYVYYNYSNSFVALANNAVMNGEYEKSNEFKAKQTEMLTIAHDWSERSFNLKKDDVQNALLLKQVKLFLGKEVSEELNAICNKANSSN